MPGQLVDRLNSGCGAGRLCQFFSANTGYFFDVERKGWLYFSTGVEHARDQQKACDVCDTLQSKYSHQSKKNADEMQEQIRCMHTRVCHGGVYNIDRDRCMCLSTQEDTHAPTRDTYGTEKGKRHYDPNNNGDLSYVQKSVNIALAITTFLMAIVFACTFYAYKQHSNQYEQFRNHYLKEHAHMSMRPDGHSLMQ
jgi:hypothetical protein